MEIAEIENQRRPTPATSCCFTTVRLTKHRLLTILRLLQAVILVIAAALVAAAAGSCASSTKGSITTTVCDSSQTPFSINHWSDGTTPYDELQGQYFVFASALFFLLASFGLFFLSFANHETDRRAIIIVCGLGALIMLISGIVESWFAAGFGRIQSGISFYVRSWLAAAVACFMVMLLYIFDIVVALNGTNYSDWFRESPSA